jgi:hypothetical protein
MATMRGGGRRGRTERKTSSSRFVAADDDDDLSDSTMRPASRVAPALIPLPQDTSDFEKSGRTSKKRTKAARKRVKIKLPVKETAVHNSTSGLVWFILAVIIAMACGFALTPGTFTVMWSYILAFA